MSTATRLTEVFRTVFGDDELEVRDDLTAEQVPDWDSLAHVNLMFAIEEEFGVHFRDHEFGQFADVGALRRFLEERVGA
jgi:acyl carrier protein